MFQQHKINDVTCDVIHQVFDKINVFWLQMTVSQKSLSQRESKCSHHWIDKELINWVFVYDGATKNFLGYVLGVEY